MPNITVRVPIVVNGRTDYVVLTVPTAAGAPEELPSLRDVRFFSDESPWNKPIPPHADYRDLGAEIDGMYYSANKNWQNINLYWADEEDPVRQVRHYWDVWTEVNEGDWKRFGNTPAVEREILARTSATDFPIAGWHQTISTDEIEAIWPEGAFDPIVAPSGGFQIHVPEAIEDSWTDDGDGYCVIFQPDGSAFEIYNAVFLSTGEVVGGFVGPTDPHGLGDGPANGRRASMIPTYAGIIRDRELHDGEINHAIAIISAPKFLKRAAVYPALTWDTTHWDYEGSWSMGTRLALPPDFNIEDYAWLAESGRVVARAAQKYGLIIVDRGGPNGVGLSMEGVITHPEWPEYNEDLIDDLNLIAEELMVVENWS